ncbi:MAG: tryptophan synthase subunit beta [Rickettsiales bacterium]|nr:tryptophan synthase subunit beta [Rickettsiales bacterium]
MTGPFDPQGRYGRYGGAFVPETLVEPLYELCSAWDSVRKDPQFHAELKELLSHWAGRPTPLSYAPRLTEHLGGPQLWLKREDLNHTGAHKLNNALGQALLARRMGKTHIIAETGAGQHGVATATACARLGLDCTVFMGTIDAERQALNVYRMQLLGARVRRVDSGSRTLKDAINEALRHWVADSASTYYLLGSALGPHPYPSIVRELQSIIGLEARAQVLERCGQLPDLLVACVGGGSNAIGLFHPFRDDPCRMIGVEAGGEGPGSGRHAARFAGGSVGVLHGTRTWLLQDEWGQILETHSVSAGLDYPAVGPEHAFLREQGRVEFSYATDQQALKAFRLCSELEGIIPALESSHALAWVLHECAAMKRDEVVLLNLSGRGDKDVAQVAALDGKRL